jgi:hypothetical protein
VPDYTADAEKLFRDFAARHSFLIEKLDNPNVELLMRIPIQSGISFELILGLQNEDELNIGIGEFWSYFFPFEHVRKQVDAALDGIASGECRIATHRQFGRSVKIELERRSGSTWVLIYSANKLRFPLVWFRTTVSYLYNDATKSVIIDPPNNFDAKTHWQL